MAETRKTTDESPRETVANVGRRLTASARQMPDELAVIVQGTRDGHGKHRYQTFTFRQLDEDSDLLADGLRAMGVEPGERLVLLVRPSFDFVSLVFALFKAAVVTVLIDPGMGRKNLVRCLEEVEPDGFVAVSPVHAVRVFLRKRFPKARHNVTVGRRWFWGGPTIRQLRARDLSSDYRPAKTSPADPAAIIFTTGSTGPPKGVLYSHRNFNKQVDEIRDFYGIDPGEIDLSGFPLFALFNCAMGVTTLIPEMDFTRPAKIDPRNVIGAVRDWKVTQSFGSPALWNVVGRYCEQHNERLPSLRRVFSAGAPVPPHVLRRMTAAMQDEGEMHTPYGATEALPVASISSSEVLGETAVQSAEGGGTCVGKKFAGIQWKVIRIADDSIPKLDEIEELPTGEIGELIICGDVVTHRYVTHTDANPQHKIQDGQRVWHRMGDLGYLDEQGRFWFCGRKTHRVQTNHGTMFTVPCEAISNQHDSVYRSALVGVGPPGRQTPVMIVEPWPEHRPRSPTQRNKLLDELRRLLQSSELTAHVRHVFIRKSLPVDIRHNAKIFREKLADWAGSRIQ